MELKVVVAYFLQIKVSLGKSFLKIYVFVPEEDRLLIFFKKWMKASQSHWH